MINITKIQKEKPIKELLEFSIINIDKPSGPTSFGTDLIIKNSLNLKKTSHFGTLDPMVTGVLPVALNRACKLMTFFIGKEKTYIGVMHLHESVNKEILEEEIKKFIGKINQLPPVKSRVKRQIRERTIYTFKILEINERDVLFETTVEAGTYIRKLVHDLGEKIGGAHMTALRRTKASIFKEPCIKISDFLERVESYKNGNENPLREVLIPGEIISQILPVVEVKKSSINNLYSGKHFFKEYLVSKTKVERGELIAAFHEDNFIGVYEIISHATMFATPKYVLQPVKNLKTSDK